MIMKPKRNFNDKCKSCNHNEKSIAWCFGVCDIPYNLLKGIEHRRNEVERRKKGLPAKLTDYIKIPHDVRDVHYSKKCVCGGTIDAYRMKESGILRAKCDTCEFSYIER